MFEFWVNLAEGLWKKKDSLIPSGGTPEERSGSTAVLNHILDRLIVTAIPEYDSGIVYKPNVIVYYHLPQDQSRVLKLLDLMTLTNRIRHSVQLATLVSRLQSHLPTKYKDFIIPLVPKLKARFQKYHVSYSVVLDLFLHTLVGRYLQDILGSPSWIPEASVDKVDCRCDDCAWANRFLRSGAVMDTFLLSQQRRSHIQGQLQTALQGGLTFTTIPHGARRYALQVTKRHETLEAGKWNTRVQKACAFIATVGTPNELARIMGDRYPDVQAALAGTKPYEIGNLTFAIPQVEGGTTAGSSTVEAATSGARAGPVVAGVKRKAEDDEDVIDLTSD